MTPWKILCKWLWKEPVGYNSTFRSVCSVYLQETVHGRTNLLTMIRAYWLKHRVVANWVLYKATFCSKRMFHGVTINSLYLHWYFVITGALINSLYSSFLFFLAHRWDPPEGRGPTILQGHLPPNPEPTQGRRHQSIYTHSLPLKKKHLPKSTLIQKTNLGWTMKKCLERDLNLRPLTSPILVVSLFCQYLCSGVPVRSHTAL